MPIICERMGSAAVKSLYFLTGRRREKLSLVVLFLAIPLFFLPKINLFSVKGETAGLRLDDLFILLFFSLAFVASMRRSRLLSQTEEMLFLFFAASLFSLILNLYTSQIGWTKTSLNPLYAVRMVEYFAFFYVGVMSIHFFSLSSFLKVVLSANALVIILQKLNLVGGFTVYGYLPSVSGQPPGLTAGHWEIGFIIAYIYSFFLFADRALDPASVLTLRVATKRRQWTIRFDLILLFSCCLLLAFLIDSRSAILSLLALTCLRLLGRQPTLYKMGAMVAVAVAMSAIVFKGIPALWEGESHFLSRSSHLFSLSNIRMAFEVFNNTRPEEISFDQVERHLMVFDSLGATDASWYVRIHKWSYVIKALWLHPFCILFGYGPGYCLTALDGGLLRLLVENGIVGALLFLGIFYRPSRRLMLLKILFYVLLVNLLFLDIYLAYKGMSLYFFVVGAVLGLAQPEEALSSLARSEKQRLGI